MKTIRNIATLTALAGLLVVPAGAFAAKGGQGKAKNCAKTFSVGYQVAGTLVSVTMDDPATLDSSEATVTLLVTSANSHARNSGELADQDADRKGVQVKGATYTVPAGDAFTLKLGSDEAPAEPTAGDRVKVSGRMAVTRKRCAPDGTSTADRYATPDIRRVAISDREPETE